jgi:hypothetical protein
MSNPIKMTLAELLEYSPLDVPKWAIRKGDKLCAWKEPEDRDEVSFFFDRRLAHSEARFRATRYTVLIYQLYFYEDDRRLENPIWRPVMSYCSKSDE